MEVRISIECMGGERPLGKFDDVRRTLVRRFERAYFELLCAACGNNVSEMARHAGIGRARMRGYLRRHGIGRYGQDAALSPSTEIAA